jgi:hypothetical protein
MKPIKDSFSSGIRLLLVGHLFYIAICLIYIIIVYSLETFGIEVVVDRGFFGIVLFIMVVAPGIVGQLVHVIPITIYLALKRKPQAQKGVLTGALITAFLNVGAIFAAISIGILLSPDTTPVSSEKNRPIKSEERMEKIEPPIL